MEKMAVTGGAGFIGSNLSKFLVSRGFKVVVVDNFTTGKEQKLTEWADRAGDEVQMLRADINETEKLCHAFGGVGFVVHQAAIPPVPRSIDLAKATNASTISRTVSVLL